MRGSRFEGFAGFGVNHIDSDNAGGIIEEAVEEFLAVASPPWEVTAATGDLPLSIRSVEMAVPTRQRGRCHTSYRRPNARRERVDRYRPRMFARADSVSNLRRAEE